MATTKWAVMLLVQTLTMMMPLFVIGATSDGELYSFVGCIMFDDEADAETGVLSTLVTQLASEQYCWKTCSDQEAEFFAMTEGTVCVCGDSTSFSDSLYSDGVCDMECAGNSADWCGGVDSYDLYEIHEIPTCSNGVVGLESESGDVCCGIGCGTCGGSKCVGEGDCCENTIQLSGVLCEEEEEAPCIINENPDATPSPVTHITFPPSTPTFCDLGSDVLISGVLSEDSSTCCHEVCPTCYSLDEDCTGASDCCADKIYAYDPVPVCSEGDEAPCIMD